jgi:hypothetical protein
MALRGAQSKARRIGCPRVVGRLLLGGVIAMAGFALLGPPLDARAEINGAGCSGHINGVDVAGVNSGDDRTAIPIDQDATISVDLSGDTGNPPTVHTDYGLVGGFAIGKDGNGSTTSIKVSDYAKVTGLYLVQATTGPNHNCSGAALVRIGGGVFSSYLGYAAVGGMALGGLGVTAGTVLAGSRPAFIPSQTTDASAGPDYSSNAGPPAEYYEGEGGSACCCGSALPMALLMTALVMTGAMPVAPGVASPKAPRLPRARWRPRWSIIGTLGGIIGSLFTVFFMELNGTVYPTRAYTIKALVAGFLVGLILPSLARIVAVRRTNRRIAARYAQWQAQRARTTVPVYEPPLPAPPGVAAAATEAPPAAPEAPPHEAPPTSPWPTSPQTESPPPLPPPAEE